MTGKFTSYRKMDAFFFCCEFPSVLLYQYYSWQLKIFSCPATPKMSSFFFVLTMLLSQRFPLLPWYILGAMKYCFLGAAVCLELKVLGFGVVALLLRYVFPILSFQEKLLNAVLQKRKDMDIYDWMRNRTDLPKHQLYIYSKADHLCSYRYGIFKLCLLTITISYSLTITSYKTSFQRDPLAFRLEHLVEAIFVLFFWPIICVDWIKALICNFKI